MADHGRLHLLAPYSRMAAMMGPRSRLQSTVQGLAGLTAMKIGLLRQYIKDIPQQLMSWLQHDLEQAGSGTRTPSKFLHEMLRS